MDLIEKIESKDLYDKLKSEQFLLSNKILKYRVGNGIDIKEAAKHLNMSLNEYHNFEYGTANKDIQTYKYVLNSLKDFPSKQ